MKKRPVVLIHGYSSKGNAFETWVNKLYSRGYDKQTIHVITYETLTNEVSIPDIAEGFDRALREKIGLNGDEEFDAIVHSTGMLVIRSWLSAFVKRRDRLKHLIGLAPASFGSPLAHKGRSWLGGIFVGRKELGPDFLEAGNRILDSLELGSRFSWELAEKDLLGNKPFYGPNNNTPYVFIFCGTEGYHGIKKLVSEPGTDGTVRWAGCALNTRKITLDLTRSGEENDRILFSNWSNVDIPLIPIQGIDHGTIMSEPSDELVDFVHRALEVESEQALNEWYGYTTSRTGSTLANLEKWQQFVIRAVDERGDPINDYYIRLEGSRENEEEQELQAFDMDVHIYSNDPSLRSFHVNLSELKVETLKSLQLRIIASSGTAMVTYRGYVGGASAIPDLIDEDGNWQASLKLSSLLKDSRVNFFHPYTTTLVEIRLNREPLPLTGPNKVCWFDKIH
ncbi:esterase/lipase family protein [Paenibacillus sepulcri]|uniref:Alpha/beta hydrolase n=1 Tax=Paenibacillus sepulcri TaxID=359917 RepID=A0ABS7BVG1_9BACL|nr:hypothetical protein [Paenibacillus sepulcri]